MKKYIFAAMLLIISAGAFAQHSEYTDGDSHIGFNIAYANPTLRETLYKDQEKATVTSLNGIKAGVVYETSIVKGFGLQLGLNYTFGTKLGKLTGKNEAGTTFKSKEDIMYHQIEIPVDWQYKFEVAKETYLLLYTGPTIEMGLGFSKNTTRQQINPATGKIEDITLKQDLYKQMYANKTDYDEDGIADKYRRLNVTWGVGAGFQYQRYFIRGGYDFGIFNPYNDVFNNNSDFRQKARFDQWSLKLGIYLWNF